MTEKRGKNAGGTCSLSVQGHGVALWDSTVHLLPTEEDMEKMQIGQ